jgi:apolipoprotein D and lipocalin family protein
MPKVILLSFLVAASALASARAATPEMSSVPQVDLNRYMGRWYVISHLPNFLERGKVGTSDNYAMQPDGTMIDTFVFHRRSLDAPEKQWSGPAWVVNKTTNAEWKVRLFWPLVASYRVLELDPDYRWVAVSNDSGSLLWVMARATTLDDGVYQGIVARLTQRGLETAKLEKVLQSP